MNFPKPSSVPTVAQIDPPDPPPECLLPLVPFAEINPFNASVFPTTSRIAPPPLPLQSPS